MRLEDELSEVGCTVAADDFRAILRSTFKEFFGDMSDERLSQRPTQALAFIAIIRQRCRCLLLNEDTIMRTLGNLRKRSDL